MLWKVNSPSRLRLAMGSADDHDAGCGGRADDGLLVDDVATGVRSRVRAGAHTPTRRQADGHLHGRRHRQAGPGEDAFEVVHAADRRIERAAFQLAAAPPPDAERLARQAQRRMRHPPERDAASGGG